MATKLLATAAGFGDLLRRILIVEKRHRLIDVATALGMTVHGFCCRMRNGGRFNPDNVATLLRVIDDDRLPHWFFAGSGLLLVRHPQAPPGSGEMTLHQRATACAADAIAAICELADTLELSMLERRQETMIEQHLDHAQSGLVSIRLQLASSADEGAVTTDHGAPEDFADLVRRVLMTDLGVRAHALADALGLSYHALHARLSGQVPFLPVESQATLSGVPGAAPGGSSAGRHRVYCDTPSRRHRLPHRLQPDPDRSAVVAGDRAIPRGPAPRRRCA